jgi:hypothetical protein
MRRNGLLARRGTKGKGAYRIEALEDRTLLAVEFGFDAAPPAALSQFGNGVALDSSGNTYVVGSIEGQINFFGGSSTPVSSHGSADAYVAKYSPVGTPLWAFAIGSTNYDTANGVAVDSSGNVYVTGQFSGTVDFNPSSTATANLTAQGSNSAFVLKLTSSGAYSFSRRLGTNTNGSAIALDPSGNILTTGFFLSAGDFDPGAGTSTLTPKGFQDAYVSKLNTSGNFVWAKSAGATNEYVVGYGITADASGNVISTGTFRTTVDFNPSSTATNNLTGFITTSGYVWKLTSGGSFSSAKLLGSSGATVDPRGITTDSSSNIYVVGDFRGTASFNGTSVTSSTNSFDAFFMKINTSGATSFALKAGGTGFDQAFGVAVDGTNVYIAGGWVGTVDFNPGGGTFNLTASSTQTAGLWRFNTSGTFVDAQLLNNTDKFDIATAVAARNGASAIAGSYGDIMDVDPGPATRNRTAFNDGLYDIFVVKFNTPPVSFVQRFGASGNDGATGVVADSSGNVYLLGTFTGTVDFNPSSTTNNLTSTGGSSDIFIAKYNSSGAYVWSRRIGNGDLESPNDIALDSSGNVIVGGDYNGTLDFDPGAGTASRTSNGFDAFVLKLNSSGNFVWVKTFTGNSFQSATGVEVDSSGNILTTGFFFSSADFDPNAGTQNLTSAGAEDIFVSKLSSAGNFVWAKRIGGTSSDIGNDIAVDPANHPYVTGDFYSSSVDFNPGAGTNTLTRVGGVAAFMFELDSAGAYVRAVKFDGTDGTDGVFGRSIAVDAAGVAYVGGAFYSRVDFNPSSSVTFFMDSGNSGYDGYIARINADGTFGWARQIGETNDDQSVNDVALDGNGNVFAVGNLGGSVVNADYNFPGRITLNAGPGEAGFEFKFSTTGGAIRHVRMFKSTSTVQINAVFATSSRVYVVGAFAGTIDLDPTSGVINRTSAGGLDVLLDKLVT